MVSSILPKNERKQFDLRYQCKYCKLNFFLRFLEELKTPKGHFEINWPLQDRRIVKYEIWFFVVKIIWTNRRRSWFVLFILLGPDFERTILIGLNLWEYKSRNIQFPNRNSSIPSVSRSLSLENLKIVQLFLLHSTFSPLFIYKNNQKIFGDQVCFM